VRPGANPLLVESEGAAWRQLLARSYALVAIDGVTDALTMFGHATKDNDGITAFSRDVPRRLADQTGAAVVMVDHVTKDNDSRGRFAIGGQAKMNALTGAAYTVDVAEPLGRGMRGVIVLRVAKDRRRRPAVAAGLAGAGALPTGWGGDHRGLRSGAGALGDPRRQQDLPRPAGRRHPRLGLHAGPGPGR